jgi:NAD(P)-dependent dehydrogenase (short-subunit alcohol dehydrogenase family)
VVDDTTRNEAVEVAMMRPAQLSDGLPTSPSIRLDGKKALVTGASRGIGLAAAVALARSGASVHMCSRNPEEIELAAHALADEGLVATAHALDVSDIDQMRQAVRNMGALDILVNNAGMNRPSLMVDTTVEDFDAMINLNLRATYFLTQAVVLEMIKENKKGSIINISSQMGHVGGLKRTVYCATKHALEGITKAMAVELGPRGIRVNTVCPTFIETPLTASTLKQPEMRDWIMSKIKLGRLARVEDVMGAISFLASESAGMITGSAILVDGGWIAG